MSDSKNPVADDSSDEDFFDRLLKEGEEVAYQDWDSGGPGAGAGRVSVYRFENRYFGIHDAGLEGPFNTKVEAVAALGIEAINEATVEIWDKERGVIWRKR